MTSKRIIIFLGAIALLLPACEDGVDAESGIATGVAQRQQISALETAAEGGGAAPTQGEDNEADQARRLKLK